MERELQRIRENLVNVSLPLCVCYRSKGIVVRRNHACIQSIIESVPAILGIAEDITFIHDTSDAVVIFVPRRQDFVLDKGKREFLKRVSSV